MPMTARPATPSAGAAAREHVLAEGVRAVARADVAAMAVIGVCDDAQVYVVGGAVRDVARGASPKDVDLLVGGLDAATLAARVQGLRGRADMTGAHFGVLRYRHPSGAEVEIALPRTDRSTGPGHRDFEVRSDPFIPVEDDLARRDFTANAMALEWHSGRLIDPYGGQADIAAGRLRLVNPEAFADDPLRVLRALGARSRHGLVPDADTAARMRRHAQDLAHLPGERVRAEWERWMAGADPAAAMRLAADTGVLAELLPDRGDSARALEILADVAQQTDDPMTRTAAVCLGMDPQALGARLRTLAFANADIKRVTALVGAVATAPAPDPVAVRAWMSPLGADEAAVAAMLVRAEASAAQAHAGHLADAVASITRAGDPLTLRDLALGGEDLAALGVPRGPQMGETLRTLLATVHRDPAANTPERLRAVVADALS